MRAQIFVSLFQMSCPQLILGCPVAPPGLTNGNNRFLIRLSQIRLTNYHRIDLRDKEGIHLRFLTVGEFFLECCFSPTSAGIGRGPAGSFGFFCYSLWTKPEGTFGQVYPFVGNSGVFESGLSLKLCRLSCFSH